DIWSPKFTELKNQIRALQGSLDTARGSNEESLAAVGRLTVAIRDLTPLEQIQQEAAIVFEALVRAAGAATPAALDIDQKVATESVKRIDDLVSGLDPDVSLALIIPLSRMRANAIGSSSIIAARKLELEAVEAGRNLTIRNSMLSSRL